jgi:two-component system, response regulator YesN
MYRVLIVDDETYVVDWLSVLLESRTEPEFDVCRAYSASEALGWLNRAKIDIIVTDIRMPEMSGITLAEKVRQNWPQCKVILLTAYSEFDYAYEAIKNNVIGYILKTEDDERILSEVDKAVALLDSEMKNFELLDQVQNQINNSMSVICKEIIYGILNEDGYRLPELFEQLKIIGADITAEKSFIIFIGRIENKLSDIDIVERYRQLSSVQKTVEQYFDRYFFCNCVEYALNKIVWLMQVKSDGVLETKDSANVDGHEVVFATGMLETVQHSCMDTSGLCVSFILHGGKLEAEQLSEKFHSLDRLFDLHVVGKNGFIINDTAIAVPAADEVSVTLYSKEFGMTNISAKLKICLENNSREEYLAELEKITGWLEKQTSWYSNAALENYYSVALAIISYINQRNLSEKVESRIALNRLFKPTSAGTWNNVTDYLRSLSIILFDLQEENEGQLSNNIVRFLHKYIKENITGDVSLVRLSEVSGYNASYLSRFFKESTGETLNDYICRHKLNKIRELMDDESLNIGDVAAKAGFDSRTYFNRFIKRVTGMSPQEYRGHLPRG